jgi:hypothetical protein
MKNKVQRFFSLLKANYVDYHRLFSSTLPHVTLPAMIPETLLKIPEALATIPEAVKTLSAMIP